MNWRFGMLALVVSSLARPEQAQTSSPSPIATALAAASVSGRVPEDLAVEVGWRDEPMAPHQTLRIWGDGIGILNESLQFRLPKGSLLELVQAVAASNFDLLTSENDKESEEDEGANTAPVRNQEMTLRMRVRVAVGTHAHVVARTFRADRLPALEELGLKIISICEPLSRLGQRASSFAEALALLDKGALSRHAFGMSYQVYDEQPGAGGVRAGFNLSLNGANLERRTSKAGAGVGPSKTRRLGDKEFRALVRALTKARLEDTPGTLAAARFEDLHIEILGRVRNVQARRLSASLPSSTLEPQKRYEALRRFLVRVYELPIAP